MWNIESTNEVAEWTETLNEDEKTAILEKILILQEIGPKLGRPFVDTVYNSKHTNMKELRIDNKNFIIRIFFAFDPKRKGILLIGGSKKGIKNFYEKMLPIADKLYDRHLKELEKERINERKNKH
jgi:hypothetical protein